MHTYKDIHKIHSLEELCKYEKFLLLEREKISLFSTPFLTIRLCCMAFCYYFKLFIHYIITHPIVLFFILPIFSIWIIVEQFPYFPYHDVINNIEFVVLYITWWMRLGILSSIGMGCGLQSGMLFIYQVYYNKSKFCNNRM